MQLFNKFHQKRGKYKKDWHIDQMSYLEITYYTNREYKMSAYRLALYNTLRLKFYEPLFDPV